MIKKYIILLLLLLGAFISIAQDTSTNKVTITTNDNGEVYMNFPIDQAKDMLADLLDYEIVDSLLKVHEYNDSINNNTITLLKSEIENLQLLSSNCKAQKNNLQEIIDNLTEIDTKNALVIADQQKEIRKQKTLKIVVIVVSAVIEGLTIGLLLGR